MLNIFFGDMQDAIYNTSAYFKYDYEPLTDDEKEAMSDAEVEKYEKKIKCIVKADR